MIRTALLRNTLRNEPHRRGPSEHASHCESGSALAELENQASDRGIGSAAGRPGSGDGHGPCQRPGKRRSGRRHVRCGRLYALVRAGGRPGHLRPRRPDPGQRCRHGLPRCLEDCTQRLGGHRSGRHRLLGHRVWAAIWRRGPGLCPAGIDGIGLGMESALGELGQRLGRRRSQRLDAFGAGDLMDGLRTLSGPSALGLRRGRVDGHGAQRAGAGAGGLSRRLDHGRHRLSAGRQLGARWRVAQCTGPQPESGPRFCRFWRRGQRLPGHSRFLPHRIDRLGSAYHTAGRLAKRDCPTLGCRWLPSWAPY